MSQKKMYSFQAGSVARVANFGSGSGITGIDMVFAGAKFALQFFRAAPPGPAANGPSEVVVIPCLWTPRTAYGPSYCGFRASR
jgi:hypothetical protein